MLLILSKTGVSQPNPYMRVDSTMRKTRIKIKSLNDIYLLTNFIRTRFDADSLRLRAAFIWITENISYDVKAYHSENPLAGQLDYVIKKKKAVCAGYAALLKYLCDAFDIECDVVEGYARTSERDVVLNRERLRTNHAWNCVKVNGHWRLVDATWASSAGVEENGVLKYTIKQFDEVYYFTAPEKLILNHLPAKNKYQMVNPLVSERTFKNQLMFLSGFLKDSIVQVVPEKPVIKARMGDTVTIKLRSVARIQLDNFCVYSPSNNKVFYKAEAVKDGDWYEFRYPIQARGYYVIYFCYCYSTSSEPLFAYRLEVE
jgi:transglutaminase/protease-like cytokinesis protein 3